MIVLDSSAIVAILFVESLSDVLLSCLNDVELNSRFLSAVSYVETGTVFAGRIKVGNPIHTIEDLNTFLDAADIRIHPIDEEQTRPAMQARIEYGRGFGSPAALNLGTVFLIPWQKNSKPPTLHRK